MSTPLTPERGPFHGHMKSCPFCEGPPVPFVRFTDDAGKVVRDAHIPETEEGLHAHAQVFCHECGAEGPAVNELAYTKADVDKLKQKAIDGWNGRDSRHRELYDAGIAAGMLTEPVCELSEKAQGTRDWEATYRHTINYAVTLLEVHGDYDTCLKYLRACQEKDL